MQDFLRMMQKVTLGKEEAKKWTCLSHPAHGEDGGGFCQGAAWGQAVHPRSSDQPVSLPFARYRGHDDVSCCRLPRAPQESQGTPTSLLPSGETLRAERGAWHGFSPRGKRPGSPLAEGRLASLLLGAPCWGQPCLRLAALQPCWERSPADGCSSEQTLQLTAAPARYSCR